MNNERRKTIDEIITSLNKVKEEMGEQDTAIISKTDVSYTQELHSLIDDIAILVANRMSRGYVPTFSVKAGVVGMVAVYRQNPNKGTGKRGRPRKEAVQMSAEEPSTETTETNNDNNKEIN